MTMTKLAGTMSETITIEAYRDDWKRLQAWKEPGDGMKDALRRALNAADQDGAGLASESTAQERAEAAASDESQAALQDTAQAVESDDGPAADREGVSMGDPGAEPFETIEQLVGDEEAPEEASTQAGASAWDVDVPGSGEIEEQRRTALAGAIKLIHDRGEATATEIRKDVFNFYDGAGYASERSMWKNFLQPALGESPEIELANAHDGIWRPA